MKISSHSTENILFPEVQKTDVNKLNEIVDQVFLDNASKLIQQNSNIVELKQKTLERASTFPFDNRNAFSLLGVDASKQVTTYSETLLDHVRSKDLEGVGSQLNDIVVLAQDINVQGIINYKESKIPIIGSLINKLSPSKQRLIGKYESVSTQIGKLVKEVAVTAKSLQLRTENLDKIFESNTKEYFSLEESILLGKVKLAELDYHLSVLYRGDITDSLQAQKIQDVKDLIETLDKRVTDLNVMQTIAIQTVPMIRMIQNNNTALISKFQNLQEMTIPTWKKQFVLAISLMEQQKAVELTEKIDLATNSLLISNAQLLKQNTIRTTQALNRQVVDFQTLQTVQTTLIETVKELEQIRINSVKMRKEYSEKIVNMRIELISHQAS
jgi:uncharacterized protein YaaN involved in tellurite resistance